MCGCVCVKGHRGARVRFRFFGERGALSAQERKKTLKNKKCNTFAPSLSLHLSISVNGGMFVHIYTCVCVYVCVCVSSKLRMRMLICPIWI